VHGHSKRIELAQGVHVTWRRKELNAAIVRVLLERRLPRSIELKGLDQRIRVLAVEIRESGATARVVLGRPERLEFHSIDTSVSRPIDQPARLVEVLIVVGANLSSDEARVPLAHESLPDQHFSHAVNPFIRVMVA
jgi:hypothetical protein